MGLCVLAKGCFSGMVGEARGTECGGAGKEAICFYMEAQRSPVHAPPPGGRSVELGGPVAEPRSLPTPQFPL